MSPLKEIRPFHLVIAFLLGSFVIWSATVLPSIGGQGLLRNNVDVGGARVCNGNWQTVFAANYDMNGIINLEVNIKEAEVESLVNNGCDFRAVTVAKTDRGGWVDKVSTSYDCASVKYQNSVNGFSCASASYYDGFDNIGEKLTLDFVGNEVLHRGVNNNALGESVYVKVMVK